MTLLDFVPSDASASLPHAASAVAAASAEPTVQQEVPSAQPSAQESVAVGASMCRELVASLQGAWQNADKPNEVYVVSDRNVTRLRHNRGPEPDVAEFNHILREDPLRARLQWGTKGKFVMQVEEWSTSLAELVKWREPSPEPTSGASASKGGGKGWRWRRLPESAAAGFLTPPQQQQQQQQQQPQQPQSPQHFYEQQQPHSFQQPLHSGQHQQPAQSHMGSMRPY